MNEKDLRDAEDRITWLDNLREFVGRLLSPPWGPSPDWPGVRVKATRVALARRRFYQRERRALLDCRTARDVARRERILRFRTIR